VLGLHRRVESLGELATVKPKRRDRRMRVTAEYVASLQRPPPKVGITNESIGLVKTIQPLENRTPEECALL
jgi:hypothetical protein